MDYRKRFDQFSFSARNSSLEGVVKLKFAPFCSSMVSFLAKVRIFDFWPVPLSFSENRAMNNYTVCIVLTGTL